MRYFESKLQERNIISFKLNGTPVEDIRKNQIQNILKMPQEISICKFLGAIGTGLKFLILWMNEKKGYYVVSSAFINSAGSETSELTRFSTSTSLKNVIQDFNTMAIRGEIK